MPRPARESAASQPGDQWVGQPGRHDPARAGGSPQPRPPRGDGVPDSQRPAAAGYQGTECPPGIQLAMGRKASAARPSTEGRRRVRSARRPRHFLGGTFRREEVEADDMEERGDAILPADLLALGIGAAVVRNRQLPDPGIRLGQPGGDLGLEAETVAGEHQRLHQRRPDHLVAGFHVGQVQIGATCWTAG